jgi:uncharacterized protein YbjT (DUF2867 family)
VSVTEQEHVMRVAVAGGTGVVGRQVVEAVRDAGAEAVVLARATGVDLVTGEGLEPALAGVDAVIDASNVATTRRRPAVAFFEAATGNLLAAGQRAGVQHHVALSIVGVDRVGLGYYAGKRAQEELIAAGALPWTVLRATQFHEFPGQLLARSRGPVALLPRMRMQPVAAREVAGALVALAAGSPVGMAPELAGPEVHDLAELARQLLRARGDRRRVLAVPLPGATGRAMAGGGLLPQQPGPRGEQTFTDWLADTRP